jgi:hypothetical protein
MSRSGLTTTNANAAKASVVYPRLFAEFDFSGGAVRVWTGVGNIITLSRTFTGVGHLAGISPLHERDDVAADGLSFSLSGVPSALVSASLNEQYRGRSCTLWLGMMNASEVLVDTPLELYAGIMSVMAIDDSGDTSTISVETESHLVLLRRPRVSRWTHEEQLRLYPGDLALQYLAKLWERPLVWGVTNKRSNPPDTLAQVRHILRSRGMR